ncbi:hypothetical protein [Mycoplasmopsis gallinarum]|uniref:Putative glucose/sucrose specific PTS system IIB component n=1 Tax=Mycoplasmopsis gallinarum TaxID=29557 RepID=A0A162QHM1_9BACT|nr:hypothetical protein [Mycoplasmopsis gallinarum]OAB48650.1 putative glucose/sucrose specific PTS system IIB component [Mycoplasmopsis gallinarum]
MKKKEKFLIVFYSIITLGFCWLYWKKQNKKYLDNLNNPDKVQLPKEINLEELLTLLGSKNNIASLEKSISTLKVNFKDKNLLKIDELQNLKYVSGILVSSTKINLNTGIYTEVIFNKLNDLIN